MVEITTELDNALDGQARWMLSIIRNYASKHQIKSSDAEELFADFIGFYVEKRDEYEPERGARSTFVFQVFRSFIWRRNRKSRVSPQNLVFDLPSAVVEYDDDEIELIQAFDEYSTKSASRLAKHMGRPLKHVNETLYSLQAKVAKKQRKERVVVCK
jgi:hypothetical protein